MHHLLQILVPLLYQVLFRSSLHQMFHSQMGTSLFLIERITMDVTHSVTSPPPPSHLTQSPHIWRWSFFVHSARNLFILHTIFIQILRNHRRVFIPLSSASSLVFWIQFSFLSRVIKPMFVYSWKWFRRYYSFSQQKIYLYCFPFSVRYTTLFITIFYVILVDTLSLFVLHYKYNTVIICFSTHPLTFSQIQKQFLSTQSFSFSSSSIPTVIPSSQIPLFP